MRKFARLDDNHTEIVDAFERHGFAVLSLARMGQGVPDLLVTRAGKPALIEIKDGAKVPSRRKLTQAQEDFIKLWPVCVVDSVGDVQRISRLWSLS